MKRIPLGRGGWRLFTAHQMGTCRMGSDPQTSVANPWGELHDTKGVWIGDGSAFPTASGTNPMVTIMALAHRTAEAIAGKTEESPWQSRRKQAPQLTHDVEPIHRDRLFIGGEWVEPSGDGRIDVIDSTTEQVMGSVPEGTPADVDRAVEAARAAFDGWAATPVAERSELLRAVSASLAARGEEIAALISREVGMPYGLSQMIQAGLPAMTFGSMADLILDVELEEQVGNSLVVREPVGVVGCITPWNYPLHQICAKVAPALAAGCTVVVKPSEVTPLNAFVLAEILEEVGLPAGCFNLVTGFGPVGRRGDRRARRRRHGLVHGLDGGGQARQRGRLADRQARRARARRQVAERDPRRRRPRRPPSWTGSASAT